MTTLAYREGCLCYFNQYDYIFHASVSNCIAFKGKRFIIIL